MDVTLTLGLLIGFLLALLTRQTLVNTQRTRALKNDLNAQISALSRDVKERQLAEHKVERLSRLYAALSQCNQAIVRCNNANELFPILCRRISRTIRQPNPGTHAARSLAGLHRPSFRFTLKAKPLASFRFIPAKKCL